MPCGWCRPILNDERGGLVTKKDMARAIADETGLTQGQAREVIQRIFDGITKTLLSEGRIELRNFGVFEVRERKPRRARNPRTGEAVDVPGKRVVTFKLGKEMEERVRRLKEAPGGAPSAASE
jgi:nucleoid DNA-binding protein